MRRWSIPQRVDGQQAHFEGGLGGYRGSIALNENVVGFQNHGWRVPVLEPHEGGVVVFLTDGRAISYAESFIGFIEHYELAEIVGQPNAGTNGNVSSFTLPGAFSIGWTGMKVVKHDGSQLHLIGIQPTGQVERTIQRVIEGTNEYLEWALEIIERDSFPLSG